MFESPCPAAGNIGKLLCLSRDRVPELANGIGGIQAPVLVSSIVSKVSEMIR